LAGFCIEHGFAGFVFIEQGLHGFICFFMAQGLHGFTCSCIEHGLHGLLPAMTGVLIINSPSMMAAVASILFI